MKIIRTALVAAVAVLFWASPAAAREWGRGRGRQVGRPFGDQQGQNAGARFGMMGGQFDQLADQMAGRLGQMDGTDLAALREQMMASRGQGRGPSGRSRGGGKGSRGEGGKHVAETLEVCLEEVDSLCELDGRGLLDALTALEAAKEAAMAAKEEMTKEEWMAARESMKPEMPEEVKASLQEAMTCIKTLATDPEGHGLSEDNACLVHLAAAKEGRQGARPGRGRGGGRGKGKGKGGEKVEAILTACAAEIDFDCELDVEASDLLASVQERREAREALMAGKDDMSEEELAAAKAELQTEGEEVKAALESVRQCLSTIKPNLAEDSECLAAMPGKGNRPKPTSGEEEDTDERPEEVSSGSSSVVDDSK